MPLDTLNLTYSESGSFAEQDDQQFDIEFIGTATDDTMDVIAVRYDPLTPRKGTQLGSDSRMFVTEVQIDRIEGRLDLFRVGVNVGRSATGTDDENPLLHRVKVSSRSHLEYRPTVADRFGNRIANRAGAIFTDVLEPVMLLDYTIKANLAPTSAASNIAGYPSALHEIAGKVNSTDFTIEGETYGRRTLMITQSDIAEFEIETLSNGMEVGYYPVTLGIAFDPDGYFEHRANKGLQYRYWVQDATVNGVVIERLTEDPTASKKEAGGKPVYKFAQFKDDDGQPSGEPQWLDDLGRPTKQLTEFSSTEVETTADSRSVRVNGADFTTETVGNTGGTYGIDWWNPWIGTQVAIKRSGPRRRTLRAEITDIDNTNGALIELSVPARYTNNNALNTRVDGTFFGTDVQVLTFEVGDEADFNLLNLIF